MNTIQFASIVGTFQPVSNSDIDPIQFEAETTSDEETFLGSPQPAGKRGRRFMGNDGVNSTVILKYANNGVREITLFDGPFVDSLIGWAQQNPTIFFNFTLRYERVLEGTTDIRDHVHTNCFIENVPGREMNNDIAVVKFDLNYERFQTLDENGAPI